MSERKEYQLPAGWMPEVEQQIPVPETDLMVEVKEDTKEIVISKISKNELLCLNATEARWLADIITDRIHKW